MLQSVKMWGAALSLGLFTLGSANALTAVSSIDSTNPNAVVKAAVDNTFDILKKYKTNRSTSNKALVNEIKTSVLPYFNSKYIAASVLNRYYRSASREQFAEFTQVMEDYMTNAYIEGLNFYNQQKVSFENAQVRSPYADVTVNVQDTSSVIPVSFRLLANKDKEFRIIDFNAFGISIVNTKATEWSPILRTQGIDGLIKYVRANSTNILNAYQK